MTKKKIIILVVVLIIATFAFILIWPVRDNWRQQYLYNKILGEFSDLENAYKNDLYGGETPEETLALFIEALKKGNANLASKYFLPEKRSVILEDLSMGLKNGGVVTLVNVLGGRSKKVELYDGYVRFEFLNNEEIIDSSVDLIRNKYNNKWLIESL